MSLSIDTKDEPFFRIPKLTNPVGPLRCLVITKLIFSNFFSKKISLIIYF